MVDERRRGVLGLALALGAIAMYLSYGVNAYNVSHNEVPGFTTATSLQSGVDWGRFVKTIAAFSTPIFLAFLIGAVVLAASASARPVSRASCWIVVVVGLLVGVGAAGAAVLVVVDGSDAVGTVMAIDDRANWYERTSSVLVYLATCFGALYAAWCAWQVLAPAPAPAPTSAGDDDGDGDDDDDGDGDLRAGGASAEDLAGA